jgi:uncharacterized protein YfaS (alpha-2-macroglobulin family)
MVALGDYEDVDQSLIVLEPDLEGQLRWLNQYCLAFTPKEPVFGSLTLKATVKAGLKSLTGDALAEDQSIVVTLPSVSVINASQGTPLISYENPLRPVWTVNFNQPVDINGLKEFAFFEKHGDDATTFKVPIEAELVDKKAPAFGYVEVRIWPRENLPVNSPYALIVHPGLVSAAGPDPLDEPLTAFSGETYGPLKVTLDGPAELDGELLMSSPDGYLGIVFNNPVSLTEAVSKIEIEPKIPEFEELKAKTLKAANKTPEGSEAAKDGAGLNAEEGSPDPSDAAQGEGEASDTASSDPGEEETVTDRLVPRIGLSSYLNSYATYKITVKAGFKDGYGQVTKSDEVITFKTGAYRPAVSLGQSSGTLEKNTKPVIPITVVNTPMFEVHGYALNPAEARNLVALSNANVPYNYVSEPEKGLNYLQRLKKPKVLTFNPPKGAVNGPINMGLDLVALFGEEAQGKVLVVSIPSQQQQNYQTFSIFQITDLGLTVKMGRTSGLAWTTDLTTGLGKEGVDVEIISLLGTSLWKGKSGPEGLVELPGGDELNKIIENLVLDSETELGNSSLSLFVVATDTSGSQDQMIFWNLAWTMGFDRWSVPLDGTDQWPLGPNPLQGYLLTSQPIYKPGETANIKIIAREADGDELVNLPMDKVKLVLADPHLNVVAESVVELSPLGTASLDYQLPKQTPLGHYTLFLARDSNAPVGPSSPHPYLYSNPALSFYGTFSVENFRSPAFDITFEGLPKEAYVGDKIEVNAKALYHFGGPVSNRPAEYSSTSEDLLSYSVKRLPGFSLVNDMAVTGDEGQDGDDTASPVVTIISGSETLDEDGKLTFSIVVDPSKRPKPKNLSIHFGAQDVDSHSVFKAATILAHPASVYPALKARNMVGEAGKPLSFDFAVTTPDGNLVKNDLTVTLYQRNWNTVRRRDNGGVYVYDSKPFDEVIQEIGLSSKENATSDFELTPPKAGFYWVKAALKDEKGRDNESSVSFYVTGDEPVGWYYGNDEKLTLIADKPEYSPGETAKILVQSPFTQGEALLTVERAGIRKSEVVRITGQSPVFDIPLGPDDGPNVFVSVILSRGRIAEAPDKNNVDLGKPAIRKGYLTLRIPTQADILKVDVKTDADTYKPGGEVTVDLKVQGPDGAAPGETEIALAVVDTSLIQLMGDETYFPEKAFSSERPLSIITVNPIVNLIGRRNLLLKGLHQAGGGAARLDAMPPSPQESALRQNFKNLAFFKPDVAVADDGTAKVSFKLPDNLTTFEIYAVATGHGRLSGTGQGDFLVTKDVLLRNSLPAYSSVGDEFTAAVTVTNRTDSPGKAKVSLSAQNVELLDPVAEKEIDISPGQSVEVGFPVKTASLGQAEFTFSVTMGQDTDQALYRIDVLPLNALTTQASFLELTPGDLAVDLELQEGHDPTRGELSLELSPSLVGLLTSPLDYLKAYPYNCLEQLTSRAYGALFTVRLQKRLSVSPEEVEAAKTQVKDHILLLAQSNQGGGFTLWPSITDWEARYPALAAFALEFLLDARAADFHVDNDLINSICDYLTSFVNDPKLQSKAWYSQQALTSLTTYAVMALAKAGREVGSYVEVIYDQKESLPVVDLTNLIRALGFMPSFTGRSQLLRESILLLQNYFQVTAGQTQISQVELTPWIWSDNDKVTALALLALSETAIHNDFIPGLVRNLTAKANKGNYSSTQSNVYALMALTNYIELTEQELPKLNITALLDSKDFLTAAFTSPINPSVNAKETVANLADVKALNIKTEGTGNAWATVKLSGAQIEPDLSAEISNGLILSRSYEVIRPATSAHSQTTFQRGQVVKVTVTMMTPDHRHNLVLEDRIPAGFEAINLKFLSEDQTLIPQPNPEISGWKYNDYFWFYHQEIWPDRVSVFSDYLPAGVYTFSYLVRPITIGTYKVTGPKAEEMYSPEIFGRGQGQILTVLPSEAK